MLNDCIHIEKDGDIVSDEKVLLERFSKNCIKIVETYIIWKQVIIFRKLWRYCKYGKIDFYIANIVNKNISNKRYFENAKTATVKTVF